MPARWQCQVWNQVVAEAQSSSPLAVANRHKHEKAETFQFFWQSTKRGNGFRLGSIKCRNSAFRIKRHVTCSCLGEQWWQWECCGLQSKAAHTDWWGYWRQTVLSTYALIKCTQVSRSDLKPTAGGMQKNAPLLVITNWNKYISGKCIPLLFWQSTKRGKCFCPSDPSNVGILQFRIQCYVTCSSVEEQRTVLPTGVFQVAEERGTVMLGNARTGSAFLSFAPHFPKQFPGFAQ
jgi:hypothetical protein